MSIIITNDCINCSACEAECPADAISPMKKDDTEEKLYINNRFLVNRFVSFEHYYVNPGKCNSCLGAYPSPRCNMVCPVSCCINEEEYYHQDNKKITVKTNPLLISKISLN